MGTRLMGGRPPALASSADQDRRVAGPGKTQSLSEDRDVAELTYCAFRPRQNMVLRNVGRGRREHR